MKKTFLAVAVLFASLTASAQFYVSAAGGYSIPSAGVKFGEEISANGTVSNTYGSYGEGLHAQLRGGYFFNETFGVELGVGYLHGSDQTIAKAPNGTDVVARARAFGASASLIYKFSNNVYGRVGALTKVGGKTEAVGTTISDAPSMLPDGNGGFVPTPAGTFVENNFTQDFKGRFPLGVIAAIGYKYPLTDNLSLFGELEYMGISVTRDTSELTAFTSELVFPDGTRQVVGTLENLPDGVVKNVKYVDDLPAGNTDPSKQLSQTVPYSSFGINFGITYTFGGGKKATK